MSYVNSNQLFEIVNRLLKSIVRGRYPYKGPYIDEYYRRQLKKNPEIVEKLLKTNGYEKPVFGDKFCIALRGGKSVPRRTNSIKKWKIKVDY